MHSGWVMAVAADCGCDWRTFRRGYRRWVEGEKNLFRVKIDAGVSVSMTDLD